VLNARDAEARGARVLVRNKVERAERVDGLWQVTLAGGEVIRARVLVNAGGPWVEQIVRQTAGLDTSEGVRLVRGSHIVTRRLFDHDRGYFLQGEDGRVIFAIPYEGDFTLIGTTENDYDGDPARAVCTDAEQDYLCAFASRYFKRPVTREDVVWTYSGVRPLYDDHAKSATAATRDYVLSLDDTGAPLLNVFGGKITTYRRLAEAVMHKLAPFFDAMPGDWTAGVALPGGDFAVGGVPALTEELWRRFPFLDAYWAKRLIRAYGTEAREILGDAKAPTDLGREFGATLTEAEVRWQMQHEYARRADDVVWRRTRLGLRLTPAQIEALDSWMQRKIG